MRLNVLSGSDVDDNARAMKEIKKKVTYLWLRMLEDQ